MTMITATVTGTVTLSMAPGPTVTVTAVSLSNRDGGAGLTAAGFPVERWLTVSGGSACGLPLGDRDSAGKP